MSIALRVFCIVLLIAGLWNSVMPLYALVYSYINSDYVPLLSNCFFFYGLGICCLLILGMIIRSNQKAKERTQAQEEKAVLISKEESSAKASESMTKEEELP